MRRYLVAFLSVLMLGAVGCASSHHDAARAGAAAVGRDRGDGLASYYADRFEGRPTASGEVFHTSSLTAAHRTLPFGTRVRVTNLDNGRCVVVRINDRGPFVRGRVIDLSPAAARKIDMLAAGTAPVRLEVMNGRQIADADR